MSMIPGLNPMIRQGPGYGVADEAQHDVPGLPDEGVIVNIGDGDAPQMDDRGNILRIVHDDGSITVSLDGRPVGESESKKAREWFSNLVEDINDLELTRIAETLLTGIRDDLESRRDWVDDRAEGIKLLGLKIELPGVQGASDGAPVDGMSRVRHPLLLEAVLRFQANARSELLPTDGPVKVRNDATAQALQQDEMAQALEKDLNHYLTATAKEYYPDTDRMLFMLGFGGTSFKKVYFCPLRGRPVSETVDADDLIVSNAAISLSDAKRITHRVYMRPSTVKRLQILGVYRDIELMTAMPASPDAVQEAKASQQGVVNDPMAPEDRDREIYECYCELNIRGFEHKHKGKETGLEIPYRVTLDASSREILSIVRNYDEPTGEPGDELPEARDVFVKYTFVPGLGFYDIGLLHILGNTTNAVTALWREMIDAGMFANFPGFIMSDTGGRQNTNIFRVPPGGGALVKTGGADVRSAIMPLPYKEPGSAMFNLVTNITETGQRVGGTAELQVGEGKQDAPVGTTLALIDQATKVLNSVHKRLHASQAEEFALLVRCFREHPESFWAKAKKQSTDWNEQKLIQALNDCELVPQADPNTSSQTQRMLKVQGLKGLQTQNPAMYDAKAVEVAVLRAMGWSNPEQFLLPEGTPAPVPPEVQKDMAELQIKRQDADTKTMLAQAKIAESQGGGVNGAPPLDQNKLIDLHLKQADLRQKEMDAEITRQKIAADMSRAQMDMRQSSQEAQMQAHQIASDHSAAMMKNEDDRLEAANRQRDRESKERLAAVKLAGDILKYPGGKQQISSIVDKDTLERLRDNEPPIEGEI
jgi:hypothetical protein